jgi:hypothetical protein
VEWEESRRWWLVLVSTGLFELGAEGKQRRKEEAALRADGDGMEGRKARLKLRFTFTLLKNVTNVSENVVESRKGCI